MNAETDTGSGTLLCSVFSFGDSSFPSNDPTSDFVAGTGLEFEEFVAVTLNFKS